MVIGPQLSGPAGGGDCMHSNLIGIIDLSNEQDLYAVNDIRCTAQAAIFESSQQCTQHVKSSKPVCKASCSAMQCTLSGLKADDFWWKMLRRSHRESDLPRASTCCVRGVALWMPAGWRTLSLRMCLPCLIPARCSSIQHGSVLLHVHSVHLWYLRRRLSWHSRPNGPCHSFPVTKRKGCLLQSSLCTFDKSRCTGTAHSKHQPSCAL